VGYNGRVNVVHPATYKKHTGEDEQRKKGEGGCKFTDGDNQLITRLVDDLDHESQQRAANACKNIYNIYEIY
jgi:hypothetical protein